MTDPRGGRYDGDFTIIYEYDDLNRLVAGYLPMSPGETEKPVVRLVYDARGNLLERIEPDGGRTKYEYTPRNWVKTTTVQGGGKTYVTALSTQTGVPIEPSMLMTATTGWWRLKTRKGEPRGISTTGGGT